MLALTHNAMKSERQKQLLTGALHDLDHWRHAKPIDVWRVPGKVVTPADRDHNAAVRNAQAGVVACRAAAWLGRGLSAADRVCNSRAYAALKAKGLVAPISDKPSGRSKTTYLRLTEAGEALARKLLDEESNGTVATEFQTAASKGS
jgi:hypothetical protein